MLSKTWKNLFIKWFQKRRMDRELASTRGAISNISQDLSILAPVTPEKRRYP